MGVGAFSEGRRTLARHPTAGELSSITVPPLPGSNFSTFTITPSGAQVVGPLPSGFFQGLNATRQDYVVTATAETVAVPVGTSTVSMTASFDIIPIFQFAIFYEYDLEITPGPDMDIDGRVHSNADIYIDIQQTMKIKSNVTAAGDIWNYRYDGSTYGGSDTRSIASALRDAPLALLAWPVARSGKGYTSVLGQAPSRDYWRR